MIIEIIYSLLINFRKIISDLSDGETSLVADDIPKHINLKNSRKVNVKELVLDIFKLNDINTAILAI